jgi:hypothetical protein
MKKQQERSRRIRCLLQLDDNFKKMIKELGDAINESLTDSESVAEVIGRIRAAGYDLFLVLEVTIGFNKRETTDRAPREKDGAALNNKSEFRLTNQDTQFLRSLKISVEDGRND